MQEASDREFRLSIRAADLAHVLAAPLSGHLVHTLSLPLPVVLTANPETANAAPRRSGSGCRWRGRRFQCYSRALSLQPEEVAHANHRRVLQKLNGGPPRILFALARASDFERPRPLRLVLPISHGDQSLSVQPENRVRYRRVRQAVPIRCPVQPARPDDVRRSPRRVPAPSQQQTCSRVLTESLGRHEPDVPPRQIAISQEGGLAQLRREPCDNCPLSAIQPRTPLGLAEFECCLRLQKASTSKLLR